MGRWRVIIPITLGLVVAFGASWFIYRWMQRQVPLNSPRYCHTSPDLRVRIYGLLDAGLRPVQIKNVYPSVPLRTLHRLGQRHRQGLGPHVWENRGHRPKKWSEREKIVLAQVAKSNPTGMARELHRLVQARLGPHHCISCIPIFEPIGVSVWVYHTKTTA